MESGMSALGRFRTERMTERNAKIGPGIHCRGIGAHALVVKQDILDLLIKEHDNIFSIIFPK